MLGGVITAHVLGFGTAREAVEAPELGAAPTAVLNRRLRPLNAFGASSGLLYATTLMRAGLAAKGKSVLDDADVVAMLQAMAVGIPGPGQRRAGRQGHARRLAPAEQAAAGAAVAGAGLADCLDAAVAAAREGADATAA